MFFTFTKIFMMGLFITYDLNESLSSSEIGPQELHGLTVQHSLTLRLR